MLTYDTQYTDLDVGIRARCNKESAYHNVGNIPLSWRSLQTHEHHTEKLLRDNNARMGGGVCCVKT